jgi:SAM-dependent methyltransferase
LFVDNFPWNDEAFTRRFTRLTDVSRSYWGPAAPDVDRIESILSPAESGRRHVVDLCCGAGRHVIELAARGIRATGIDISPYAIRRARSRAAVNPAVRRGDARFIQADVLSAPDTEPADVIAILCEQIVNFSPPQAADLIGAWSGRIVDGGAMIVESPTELPPLSEGLFWMEEPLFLDEPCWVLHTQTPDPEERTLLELFSCLRAPGAPPRSFVNSRKYYTAEEIVALSPDCTAQVIEIAASPPRLDLAWIVLRRR